MAEGLRVKKEDLMSRLSTLSCAQNSVEQTATYCLFFAKDARNVVALWDEEFHKAATIDKKLGLIYLANHILQDRKRGRGFLEEFFRPLVKAFRSAAMTPDLRNKVERLLTVWEDRRVFAAAQLKVFRDSFSKDNSHPGPSGRNEASSRVDTELKRKLENAQPLVDILWEVHLAAGRTEEAMKETRKLQDKVQQRSVEDLQAAHELLSCTVDVLKTEQLARMNAVSNLRALMSQQEEAQNTNEEQLNVCKNQQLLIARYLQDTAAAAAAAASTAPPPAAAPVAVSAPMAHMPMQQTLPVSHLVPQQSFHTSPHLPPGSQAPGMYSMPMSVSQPYDPMTTMWGGPPPLPATSMPLPPSGHGYQEMMGVMAEPLGASSASGASASDAQAMDGSGLDPNMSASDFQVLVQQLAQLKDQGVTLLAAALQNYDPQEFAITDSANGVQGGHAAAEENEYDPDFPD